MGNADHPQFPLCVHVPLPREGGLGSSLLPPYCACTHSNPEIYINLFWNCWLRHHNLSRGF